jgi:hypothetical protein
MKKENEPIYPHLEHTHSGEVLEYSKGLTKREYFAGLALQGLLACSEIKYLSDDICESAVGLADELLKQLGE